MSKINSAGEAIEIVIQSLPYPQQIKNIQITKDSIYFDWKRKRYKVEFHSCSVWEVEGYALVGGDCSVLMEHLLKQILIKKRIEEQ